MLDPHHRSLFFVPSFLSFVLSFFWTGSLVGVSGETSNFCSQAASFLFLVPSPTSHDFPQLDLWRLSLQAANMDGSTFVPFPESVMAGALVSASRPIADRQLIPKPIGGEHLRDLVYGGSPISRSESRLAWSPLVYHQGRRETSRLRLLSDAVGELRGVLARGYGNQHGCWNHGSSVVSE